MDTFAQYQAIATTVPLSLRNNRDRLELPITGLQEEAGRIGRLLATASASGRLDLTAPNSAANFRTDWLTACGTWPCSVAKPVSPCRTLLRTASTNCRREPRALIQTGDSAGESSHQLRVSQPWTRRDIRRELPKAPDPFGALTAPGAIESGGHHVVGFVALRQNQPAQSGRLGGGQGCALHPPRAEPHRRAVRIQWHRRTPRHAAAAHHGVAEAGAKDRLHAPVPAHAHTDDRIRARGITQPLEKRPARRRRGRDCQVHLQRTSKPVANRLTAIGGIPPASVQQPWQCHPS